MLLAEDQIQSWVNSRTQKKKKKETQGQQTDKDIEENRLVDGLGKS
jgi:hypothetical protein